MERPRRARRLEARRLQRRPRRVLHAARRVVDDCAPAANERAAELHRRVAARALRGEEIVADDHVVERRPAVALGLLRALRRRAQLDVRVEEEGGLDREARRRVHDQVVEVQVAAAQPRLRREDGAADDDAARERIIPHVHSAQRVAAAVDRHARLRDREHDDVGKHVVDRVDDNAHRRRVEPRDDHRRQQRLRPEVLRRPHLRYEPLVPARQAQAEAAEAIEKGVGHGGAHRARHEQAARSDVRRVKVDLPHVDKLIAALLAIGEPARVERMAVDTANGEEHTVAGERRGGAQRAAHDVEVPKEGWDEKRLRNEELALELQRRAAEVCDV
mmetsp:Transcript_28163/g.93617  ORF Transcript_28163/g.93617 Transcript_28163/m.93617 type:complete len:331 (+) Transcript_28163:355-1347(+)